jgi:hypothetical protein
LQRGFKKQNVYRNNKKKSKEKQSEGVIVDKLKLRVTGFMLQFDFETLNKKLNSPFFITSNAEVSENDCLQIKSRKLRRAMKKRRIKSIISLFLIPSSSDEDTTCQTFIQFQRETRELNKYI